MNTSYLTRRTLEIKEWWLLRKNDPAAIERQRQREAIAARADADNQAWLADGQIGTAPPSSGPVGPPPRGPQAKEVITVGAIGFVILLILAAIGSIIDTPKPAPVAAVPTASALPTVMMTTPTTASKATAAADLPAVPVGQTQTITGEYEQKPFKARVTVTDVVRTTDSTIVIRAKIDITEGELPLDNAWTIKTKGGKTHPGFLDTDDAFGEVVDGKVEGEVEFRANEQVNLAEVRLQPRHYKFVKESLNETAVWTVGKVTTSITTTEPEPAPEPTATTGSGSGSDDINVPNVDAPDLIPDCVNGHRRSNGHFC
ncbi:hypothetical protein [Gordonia sp. SND2]|uniref:hypothetical protein n=1 Tax=Gordonia sp. SND2 TaxID=3388659 RepID=UPI00398AF7D9